MTTPRAGPAEDPVVVRLRERLLGTLRSVVGEGNEVALVDFPNHSNVGDSAIWLGERAALAVLGCRVRYVCDVHTYDRRSLARAVGGGPILIHGGGNFGDLYPAHQGLRERVVADFPGNPIVQLPQSIHFEDPRSLDRARAVLAGHAGLTLLLRDRESVELAETAFAGRALLCPDSVLALGPLERRPPSRALVWLARTDDERSGVAGPDAAVETFDWLAEAPWALGRVAARTRRLARDRPRLRPLLGAVSGRWFDRLAGARLTRGVHALGDGSVVVTDRLHGHLIALLMGIPHVALDTAHGKVHRFIDAWTADSPLVHRARDAAEALERARQLVTGLDGPREA